MYIDVASYATGGEGTEANPLTGWEQSVNNARAGAEIYFKDSYYTCAARLGLKSEQNVHGKYPTIVLSDNFHGSLFVNADESLQPVGVHIHELILRGNASQQTRMNHAVSLRGAIGASIHRLHLFDFSGDGIILSKTIGGLHPRGFSISGNFIARFGRNGISITEGLGGVITDCDIEGAAATADPGYGVDIEPNDSASRVSNIAITQLNVRKCKAGIGVRDGTTSDLVSGIVIGDVGCFDCDTGLLLYYASNVFSDRASFLRSRDSDIKAIGNACNNIVLDTHKPLNVIEEADGQYVPAGNLFR